MRKSQSPEDNSILCTLLSINIKGMVVYNNTYAWLRRGNSGLETNQQGMVLII